MSLIKHISKGSKMNLWENLEIYKHKNKNKLIKEQASYFHASKVFNNILKVNGFCELVFY